MKKKNLMSEPILFLVVLFLLNNHAHPSETDTSPADIGERIHTIQTNLTHGEQGAKLWWYGWIGFYTGAAVLSFTTALTSDSRATRVFQSVQGAESLLGAGGLLVFPFPAKSAGTLIKDMPETTYDESIAKLQTAESLLRESAEAEIAGRSWLQHTLALLVNATGSMIILKGYEKQIKDAGKNPATLALLNFFAGEAVAELQIWTQPTRAIDDWNNYKSRYSSSLNPREKLYWNVFFQNGDDNIIAGIVLSF